MVQSLAAGKAAENENNVDYVLNVLDQVLPPVDGNEEPKPRIPTPTTNDGNPEVVINFNANGKFFYFFLKEKVILFYFYFF